VQQASEWQIVFYMASAVYLVGAVIYGVFASGERQIWAQDAPQSTRTLKGECNNALELDSA
jgi:ACS family sodium-dependent inorganic phosphate cotransporter